MLHVVHTICPVRKLFIRILQFKILSKLFSSNLMRLISTSYQQGGSKTLLLTHLRELYSCKIILPCVYGKGVVAISDQLVTAVQQKFNGLIYYLSLFFIRYKFVDLFVVDIACGDHSVCNNYNPNMCNQVWMKRHCKKMCGLCTPPGWYEQ